MKDAIWFAQSANHWCEYRDHDCTQPCPLSAAEKKLREAHHHWHACGNNYHNPESFGYSLNATIQTLRNVTFALQSSKSKIPGFDEWYPLEQKSMKTDPLLKWVVDSRNKVVKQGDLTTWSESRVLIIHDYSDEAEIIKRENQIWNELETSPAINSKSRHIERPVSMDPSASHASLGLDKLPLSIKQRLTIYYERRWVEESIPDYEVLTILSYCYGKLRQLIQRGHEFLGLNTNSNRRDALATDDGFNGRLPCMVSTREFRTMRRRYLDSTEVKEYLNRKPVFDAKAFAKIIDEERYGPRPNFPAEAIGDAQKKNQLISLASFYSEIAKGILLSGEEHGWYSYYLKKGTVVDSRIHATVDGQGKRAIAAEIAYTALRSNADAVVMINEVWISEPQLTKDGAIFPPSLAAERGEAISVDAIAKSGARASLLIPFQTLSGISPERVVRIDQVEEISDDLELFFSPLFEVWGLNEHPTGEKFWRMQKRRKSF